MEHYKLLIVGAGASGIAASARLLENGFSNFRILEAENRIGGRVNSIHLENAPVELGAEWIHGETGNVVYELASKFNLADNTSKYFFDQTKFFEYSGHLISKDVSQAFVNLYENLIDINEQDLPDCHKNSSLGEYFDKKFEKAAKALRKDHNISNKLCEKFKRLLELWENSIDASHSWYETSLSGHLEYWECPGNVITRWKNNSYGTLFDLLTKKNLGPEHVLPVEEKIYLSKEVSNIKWNKECDFKRANIVIMCSDGSSYSADHVLLTCSLGVLKDRSSTLFLPQLPSKKLSCIKNLGFGTVDKIFLKFQDRWWKDDFEGFAFLWSEDERKKDESGWLSGVICFHPVDFNLAVLRGWITGEAAQRMETLSNQEITEGLQYLLDKFLGSSYSVSPIKICLTSTWFSNPHFRGSYSCRLLASERANVWASDLAEPVCNSRGLPVLLFGGEATSNHFFSTVHGAIESGWREADRLLSLFRKTTPLKKSYQVVIVGGGISGLSAAKTLYESEITDLLVLEAQAKPGGRISTVQVDDYHLELGAQWIHGEKNEVFQICKKNHLLTEEPSSEGEGLYLRENGEPIDEKIIREVDDVIKTILENCEVYATDNGKSFPSSVGEELSSKFNEYLEKCDKDSEKVKHVKRDLFDWHIKFQLIDNSCSHLNNLSAKAWGLFKFCGGSDYVNFKMGYETLITILLECLPKDAVLCNVAVDKIEWAQIVVNESEYRTETSGVKIICKNGLEFTARHVIVTCSLGCLKSNHKTMFSPSLPKYLTEAIEMLGFGVLNKIFLIYDSPWWEPDTRGFQLVWCHEHSSENKDSWGKYVTGFDVVMKGKPVLLGWVGGEGAKMIEKLSPERVGREATELLNKFYRKAEVPLPKKVLRSSWWSNEYIRGGYSHITVKCDDLRINGSNLARPVYSNCVTSNRSEPRILLAGECTHKNYFSTVHGAYESGQRQARVLCDHFRSQIDEKLSKLNFSSASVNGETP